MRIVFVCSGNICRSPMAEVLGRHFLAEAGVEAEVCSGGTLGISEYPAARYGIEVLEEIGHDLGDHRSQGISFGMLERTDVFVVMSPSHEEELCDRLGVDPARICRMWEFTDESDRLDEIADPVGQDRDEFRRCRDDLIECLPNWVATLRTTDDDDNDDNDDDA